MSYVREVLQPGEEIRFRTNVHWLVYLPAMMMFVVGLAFALWYTAAPSHHLMLVILSGLSAVAGVLLFILGLPGSVASVTSMGIRVARTASTKMPPCSRTPSMWRSAEVLATVPGMSVSKSFMT